MFVSSSLAFDDHMSYGEKDIGDQVQVWFLSIMFVQNSFCFDTYLASNTRDV